MIKGFTLIEVLVTSIILGFVLSGVAMFLLMTAQISDQAIVDSRAQTNLNIAYRDIANEIRNSKRVRASTANKDTLDITRIDNTHVFFLYDNTNKKIRKKIGGAPFEDIQLITTGCQTNKFDCSFSNDVGSAFKVIFIEKLTCSVENKGKIKTFGLTGHGTGTSISCRND